MSGGQEMAHSNYLCPAGGMSALGHKWSGTLICVKNPATVPFLKCFEQILAMSHFGGVEALGTWGTSASVCPDQQDRKSSPFLSRIFIAHMVQTYQMAWTLKENLVWMVFLFQKIMVLCTSAKDYCST